MTTRLLTTQRIVNLANDPASGTSGELYYNTTENELKYYNGTEWLSVHHYTDQVKHLVKNDSGGVLTKGSLVYTSGANGTNILVKAAQATSDQLSASTLGFLETTLANNGSGYVVTNGLLGGLNTSAATVGDPIWLSPSTAGGVVYGLANKPEAPNHLVYLGVVTKAHSNNGEVFVHISNGWELDELHNVKITTPLNNDTLVYNSSSAIWVNAQPNEFSVSSGSAYPTTSLTNGQLFYNTSNGRTAIYFNSFWKEFSYVTDSALEGGMYNTTVFDNSVNGGDPSTLIFIGNYDGGEL